MISRIDFFFILKIIHGSSSVLKQYVIGMGEPGLYDTPDAVARVIHSLDHVCIVGILMVPVMKRTTR